jgi:hypothetical protein
MESTPRRTRPTTKLVAVAAMALGVAAGSYGIASAATGSGSSSSSGSTTPATTLPSITTQPHTAPDSSKPWGGQRSDETLLTGDTESKVEAAAVAKVGSGDTVVRVETDADGHAAYEVHMVKADGTPTTVYVDEQFDVVSVETR